MEDVLQDTPSIRQELADYREWQQRLIESESFNKIIDTLARSRESLPDADIVPGVKCDKSKLSHMITCFGEAVAMCGKYDIDGVIEYMTLAVNSCEFMVCVDVTENDSTVTNDINDNADRVYVGSSGHVWAETDQLSDWSVDALVDSAEARAKVEQVFDRVASVLGPF